MSSDESAFPPLEDYEQEIYDNMADYETEEMDDDGKMVKLEPGWEDAAD